MSKWLDSKQNLASTANVKGTVAKSVKTPKTEAVETAAIELPLKIQNTLQEVINASAALPTTTNNTATTDNQTTVADRHSNVSDLLQTFQGQTSNNIATTIQQAFTDTHPNTMQAIQNAQTVIANNNGVAPNDGSLIKNVTTAIQADMANNNPELLQNIQNGIQTLAANNPNTTQFLQTAQQTIAANGGKLPGDGSLLKGYIDSAAADLQKNNPELYNTIKDQFTKFQTENPNLTDFFNTAQQTIAANGGKLPGDGSLAKGFFDSAAADLKNNNPELYDTLKTQFTDFQATHPTITKFFETAGQTIADNGGKLPGDGTLLKGFFDSAKTDFINNNPTLSNFLETAKTTIADNGGKLPGDGSLLKGFIDTVKTNNPEAVSLLQSGNIAAAKEVWQSEHPVLSKIIDNTQNNIADNHPVLSQVIDTVKSNLATTINIDIPTTSNTQTYTQTSSTATSNSNPFASNNNSSQNTLSFSGSTSNNFANSFLGGNTSQSGETFYNNLSKILGNDTSIKNNLVTTIPTAIGNLGIILPNSASITASKILSNEAAVTAINAANNSTTAEAQAGRVATLNSNANTQSQKETLQNILNPLAASVKAQQQAQDAAGTTPNSSGLPSQEQDGQEIEDLLIQQALQLRGQLEAVKNLQKQLILT